MYRNIRLCFLFMLAWLLLFSMPLKAQEVALAHTYEDIRTFLPLVMYNYTPPSQSGIANGDFESGHVAWTESTQVGGDLITEAPNLPGTVTPHSGNWVAWLGGNNDDISYIEQQVTISASAPFLAYWRWIASEDICGYGYNFDYGQILINDFEVQYIELCKNASTNGWEMRTVDLSGYAGQTVSLKILVETDLVWNSNLFIDDVSLQSGP